jgi:hypothetical protein
MDFITILGRYWGAGVIEKLSDRDGPALGGSGTSSPMDRRAQMAFLDQRRMRAVNPYDAPTQGMLAHRSLAPLSAVHRPRPGLTSGVRTNACS